jgi:hypothetical protein
MSFFFDLRSATEIGCSPKRRSPSGRYVLPASLSGAEGASPIAGRVRRVYEHYPGCNREVVWSYRSNSWLGFAVFQKGAGRKQNQAWGQEFQISTPALVVFLAGCAIFILPPVIHMPNDTLISFQWPGVAGTTTTINGSTQLPFPTDRDHPLKLRSNEIRGTGLDKQTVRYYFSFVGGQVRLS